MNRFFLETINDSTTLISLLDEDAFHINNVLRLKHGDEIIISDLREYDYLCKIISVSKSIVNVSILNKTKNESEPSLMITIYQSMPKADKMELIIQKSVELGVFEIVPFISEFSISRPTNNANGKIDNKINRYQKISEAAAKQSGRLIVPKVTNILSFNQALEHCLANDKNIVAYEKEENVTLKSFLKSININECTKLGVFIGPEGGFSEKEIAILKSNNIFSITLGKRILRTETASLSILSIINYEI